MTEPIPTPHLTTAELDDLLLGEPSARAEAHVALCGLCHSRVQAFTTVVGDFNQASMAWANAKSNTISRDLSHALADRGRSWLALAPRARAWAGSLAAVGIVAAAVIAGVHTHEASSAVASISAPARGGENRDVSDPDAKDGSTKETEIARDNEMLRAIDSAINAPIPSPEQLYHPTGAIVPGQRAALQVLN